MLKSGDILEVNEIESLTFYNELIRFMKKNKYIHYEISNFALPGYYSKHNMNYWKNVPYIGLGPSAHSYNENKRYWNVSSVKNYIKNIENKIDSFESENLNITDKYNEYIITGLRTKWGCNLNFIKSEFGKKFYKHSLQILDNLKFKNIFNVESSSFSLYENKLLQSDYYIDKFIL